MSAFIVVPYAGEEFFPSLGTTFEHDGHTYTAGELMHIEARGGIAKSSVRAYDGNHIVYFEFHFELSTNEQAGGNVHQLPQPQKARA